MKKQVLLIGGRSKAKALALCLIKRGYGLTVINDSYEDCLKLAELDKVSMIHGDGSRPFVLEEAGARNCEMAIALTSKDEDNLVICELCKKRFGVKKTLSLLSDPKKTNFFYKMGIDSVVCAISAVTGIIEQEAFLEEMTHTIPIGEGRLRMAELPISDHAPVVGRKLWEINLPGQVIIGCILRGSATIIPRGDTKIFAGDILILISAGDQEIAAIKELTGR